MVLVVAEPLIFYSVPFYKWQLEVAEVHPVTQEALDLQEEETQVQEQVEHKAPAAQVSVETDLISKVALPLPHSQPTVVAVEATMAAVMAKVVAAVPPMLHS